MFFCFYEEDSGLSDKGKQGKRPEENTKKRPDSTFLLENLNRLLIPLKKINFSA